MNSASYSSLATSQNLLRLRCLPFLRISEVRWLHLMRVLRLPTWIWHDRYSCLTYAQMHFITYIPKYILISKLSKYTSLWVTFETSSLFDRLETVVDGAMELGSPAWLVIWVLVWELRNERPSGRSRSHSFTNIVIKWICNSVEHEWFGYYKAKLCYSQVQFPLSSLWNWFFPVYFVIIESDLIFFACRWSNAARAMTGTKPTPSAAAGSSAVADAQTSVNVDSSQPTTNLQIRLADGSRYEHRFHAFVF